MTIEERLDRIERAIARIAEVVGENFHDALTRSGGWETEGSDVWWLRSIYAEFDEVLKARADVQKETCQKESAGPPSPAD